MADGDFKIDGLDNLNKALAGIANRFPQEIEKELLKLAYMLDREIVLQITDDGIVDTGRLRASFTLALGSTSSKESPTGEGAEGQAILSGDNIEVGTITNYAQYINDGFTVEKRFVPGEWNGEKFKYNPNAKTGMTLHPQFVMGKHFMEKGMQRFEPIARQEIERFIESILGAIEKNNAEIIDTFKNL